MPENIETCLEDRIRKLFEELDNETVGTERYKALTEELQKLYDLKNREILAHAEECKVNDAKELEEQRLEFDKYNSYVEGKRSFRQVVVDVGTTVFSVVSSIFLSRKIMKFEETGVLTSKTWNICIPKIRWKH